MYVGRCRSLGPTTFGNHVAFVDRSLRGAALVRDHERCVREYARWFAAPAQVDLRATVRRVLRGRYLACHCAGRGLPCHAEVLAAWANSAAPASTFAAA